MISFVYFDVGGVVIDDFSGNNKWNELTDEIGVSEGKREVFKNLWDRYDSEFCTTRDIDELMVPLMRESLGVQLPDDYSLNTALVKRFYANELIWPIVNNMKSKTQIGLITNMSPGMLGLIREKGILPDVEWDQIIDSSVEHVMKPDPRIFQIAQDRAGVSGDEILFIDNSAGHVAAGKAFGWQTFLYDPSNHAKSTQNLAAFLSTQQFSK